MTSTKLARNPFNIGDKEVYLNEGTKIFANDGTTMTLDSVTAVHVAEVSQPFTYEQETIDGNCETVEVPGEITFWLDEDDDLAGAFYRTKVEQKMIDFHKSPKI